MGISVTVSRATVRRGGRAVLAEITTAIAPGALTALVGPNGAGKSTLLQALAGLLPLAAGRIELADQGDIARLPDIARARLIGWSPPSFDPAFAFSALDTVVLGRYPWHLGRPTSADRAAAAAALDRLGIAALARRS